jgi:hypothetical protein
MRNLESCSSIKSALNILLLLKTLRKQKVLTGFTDFGEIGAHFMFNTAR